MKPFPPLPPGIVAIPCPHCITKDECANGCMKGNAQMFRRVVENPELPAHSLTPSEETKDNG